MNLIKAHGGKGSRLFSFERRGHLSSPSRSCLGRLILICANREWGGSAGGAPHTHFPCTWVKHLLNLLRNKVNSQQYPRIFEDRRRKSIQETEKTDGKGIASGQKGPWDQCGEEGDCSPRLAPKGAAGLLGESPVNSSLPAKQGLNSTNRDLVA